MIKLFLICFVCCVFTLAALYLFCVVGQLLSMTLAIIWFALMGIFVWGEYYDDWDLADNSDEE